MHWHNSHKANYNKRGRNVRQVQKCIQQTKSLIEKVIKIIPKNNSVNNVKLIKEICMKLNIFQNIKTARLTFTKRLKHSIGYKIQKINTCVHYKKQNKGRYNTKYYNEENKIWNIIPGLLAVKRKGEDKLRQ